MRCLKQMKISVILFILLFIGPLHADDETDNDLITNKNSEVDFSGYTEDELDSLAYYYKGLGLNTFNGYSKIEEKLYKVDIHPQTPKEGITTGYAILYGHYVKPPYKFEIINDTILYLNGIQLDPKIENKVRSIAHTCHFKRLGEKAKNEGLIPYREHISNLSKEIESIYKTIIPTKGGKATIDTITNLLKNDSLVYKFKITPVKDDLVIVEIFGKKPDGGLLPGRILELRLNPFNPYKGFFPEPKDETEKIRWRRESLERQIITYEENLKKGGTPFGSFSKNYALEIYRIMSDSINIFMKVDKLKKIVSDEFFFKEIIYNYRQEEYQEVEKR